MGNIHAVLNRAISNIMKQESASIHTLAEALGQQLRTRAWSLVIAESCTGGELCAAITNIPGSSCWFDRGFVTYSNNAKESMLNVPRATLITHGAVSEESAVAMANGALLVSNANIAIAITGIAGPSGGSTEKPIGTVWIACASENQSTQAIHYLFSGNRQAIRKQAVFAALHDLLNRCAS
jgi:nicotinamide-nucleotide amidase